MIDAQNLEKQLLIFKGAGGTTKKLLLPHLNDNEIVKGVSQNVGTGISCFTDSRIIFITAKGALEKEYTYDDLTDLSAKKGTLSGAFTLTLSGETKKVKVHFANFINTLDFLKDKISDEATKKAFLEKYPEIINPPKKKSKWVKKLAYAFAVFVVLIIAIGFFADGSTNNTTDIAKASNTDTKSNVAKTSNADIKAKITDILKDEFDKDLISVGVNDNAGKNDGSKIVLIHATGRYGYSDIPAAILTQDYTIFKLLYTSQYPISEATIFTETKLVDKGGNESQDTVMKTTLDSNIAKNIDWKNSYVDLKGRVSNVWISSAIKPNK